MTILLYANNAASVLGAPTPASGGGSTTITLSTGAGALYPSPSTGQGFYGTLRQASNLSVTEIVLVTARSGDTLTVVRAQDGTTARNWLANDKFDMFPTAATMRNQVQADQLQLGTYVVTTAGGSANALTATLPSALTSLADGMEVHVFAAAANTGAATLDLTLGSTATGALAIVKGNNAALVAGDIAAADYCAVLIYNATLNKWVMQNPATGIQPVPNAQLPTRGWVQISFGGSVDAQAGDPCTPSKTGTGEYTVTFSPQLPSGTVGFTVSVQNGSKPLWTAIRSRTHSGINTTDVTFDVVDENAVATDPDGPLFLTWFY